MSAPLRLVTILVVLGVAGATACGEAPDGETGMGATDTAMASADTAVVPVWVEDVAAVANAIEQRPGAVDSVLGAHGMTRSRFDSLIYVVAADPTLTEAYQAARAR